MLTTEQVEAINHIVLGYKIPKDQILPMIHKACVTFRHEKYKENAPPPPGPTCQCFGAGSPDPCPIHDGTLEDLEDGMPDEVDGAR